MERMKDRLKILISYHKESERIESEIMMPIQVGAQGSKVDLKMQRDDEGSHISDKNDKYCELTAQYWAWKNLDVDYYGFMHYRRHFIFKDIAYEFDDGRPVSYRCINRKYKETIGLDDATILRCIDGYDLVLPLPVDTSSWGAVSNEVQFCSLKNLHATDFDRVCGIVTALYPEYDDAVQEFRTGHYAYWYNMFIMKKEIFTNYCAWLFRILDCSEEKIDFSKYDQQEMRTLAFMAERLFSIYLIKLLKEKPELKVKHLKMTFVHHTDRKIYEDVEDIEVPIKKYAGVDYVYTIEKAYKELKHVSLPYSLEDVFQIKNNNLEALLKKKDTIFYGGGDWCRQFLQYFKRLGIKVPIEIWDREAECGQTIDGIPLYKPDMAPLQGTSDRLWIITIRNQSVSSAVKQYLRSLGVTNMVENRQLVSWLSGQLWLQVSKQI